MANKYVKDLSENTSPASTDAVEIDDGVNSEYVTLANLVAGAVTPGTSGNVMTSNGTEWTSAAATGGGDGWIAGTGTWSYSSADAPTFIISANNDQTAIVGVGQRIKLTQTTAKYFIVTAVGTFGGGVTLITVYGGTDYTLANEAITTPFISGNKAPLGFPASPLKWTVELTDVTNRSQASPTSGTWYNLGSLTISIPIGCWSVEYLVYTAALRTGTDVNSSVTLSTANNSESDADFTNASNLSAPSGNLFNAGSSYRRKYLLLATKTSYYINAKVAVASTTSLNFYNADSKLTIRAICAYL